MISRGECLSLLREIEAMICVEPGDLRNLPQSVATYIRHSQELLCATVRERDARSIIIKGAPFSDMSPRMRDLDAKRVVDPMDEQ